MIRREAESAPSSSNDAIRCKDTENCWYITAPRCSGTGTGAASFRTAIRSPKFKRSATTLHGYGGRCGPEGRPIACQRRSRIRHTSRQLVAISGAEDTSPVLYVGRSWSSSKLVLRTRVRSCRRHRGRSSTPSLVRYPRTARERRHDNRSPSSLPYRLSRRRCRY